MEVRVGQKRALVELKLLVSFSFRFKRRKRQSPKDRKQLAFIDKWFGLHGQAITF